MPIPKKSEVADGPAQNDDSRPHRHHRRRRPGSGLGRRSQAQAQGLVNCVEQTHRGACYEFVWVNGVEVRMTFPQVGTPLAHVPNAKVQNFYVIAAQTDTPQGDIPPIHDHTIQAAPGDPGWTPFMHGYFVICSAEGLASGACVAVSTDFGFGPLPLAQSVNGEPLASAATIEAGIDAGLLVAVDTGAVLIGTVSPAM